MHSLVKQKKKQLIFQCNTTAWNYQHFRGMAYTNAHQHRRQQICSDNKHQTFATKVLCSWRQDLLLQL